MNSPETKIKIAIQTPCRQSWEDMAPASNGRHCQHCEKEVIDFTKMSSKALQDWFAKAKGQTCGRILPFQLEESAHLRYRNRNLSVSLAKLLVATCLAVVSTLKSSAAESKKPDISINIHKKNAVGQQIEKAASTSTTPDSLVRVTGIVRDAQDKLPIPGALVRVKNLSLLAYTDVEGKFSIDVPAHHRKITISLSYLGYVTQEKEVNLDKAYVEIIIEPTAAVMGLVIIERRYQNFFLNTGAIIYRKIKRLFI